MPTQVRKWVLTPNVPAPPPKPFVTHRTRTWVMLNWRVAAGSNEEVTAYIVSWRLGRKGNFDDELTVRARDSTVERPAAFSYTMCFYFLNGNISSV